MEKSLVTKRFLSGLGIGKMKFSFFIYCLNIVIIIACNTKKQVTVNDDLHCDYSIHFPDSLGQVLSNDSIIWVTSWVLKEGQTKKPKKFKKALSKKFIGPGIIVKTPINENYLRKKIFDSICKIEDCMLDSVNFYLLKDSYNKRLCFTLYY